MSNYLGDTVRLSATFRSPRGVLTDPTATILTIHAPGGDIVVTNNSGLVRVSLGVYRYDYLPTDIGTIQYEWEGQGSALGNRMGFIRVIEQRPDALLSWSPAGDHKVFDNLEPVTIVQRDGRSISVSRALRFSATNDQGSAGSLTAFGATTAWDLWTDDCSEAPDLNGLLKDSYGKNYRIDRVSQNARYTMWRLETTCDAGEGL